MELLPAKEMDIDFDAIEVPEGMAISVFPPAAEHLQDPIWFDSAGRDPMSQWKVFKLDSRDALKEKMQSLIRRYPKYGPAMYERAAKEGQLEVIEVLLDLNVEMDPDTMKQQQDDEDEDEDEGDEEEDNELEEDDHDDTNIEDAAENVSPIDEDEEQEEDDDDDDDEGDYSEEDSDDDVPSWSCDHAYLTAILNGHFDIVKLLVERGGVPINYAAKGDGLYAVSYAASKGHTEIARWVIERGASITLERNNGQSDDLQLALKSGQLEIVNMILSHPQCIASGRTVEFDHLSWAAHSGNDEMICFVLQSDCFGIKDPLSGLDGHGEISLSNEQKEAILESIPQATGKNAFNSVKLLLKQLTPVRDDGSLAPFSLPFRPQAKIYNAAEDALDDADTPELCELLFDTVLNRLPEDAEEWGPQSVLPLSERLGRHLIAACGLGRVATVELLITKYGANANHISHKFFTTPLSRAAASGANPQPGRLEVAKYLIEKSNADIELGVGEFCNGNTALSMALMEASYASTRKPELKEMVALMLELGGPVDHISEDLSNYSSGDHPDKTVTLYALYFADEARCPVVLSIEDDADCDVKVMLEYKAMDLQTLLSKIKIRSDNDRLKANDPRGRPLMPGAGEELAEEKRAKPKFLAATMKQ